MENIRKIKTENKNPRGNMFTTSGIFNFT